MFTPPPIYLLQEPLAVTDLGGQHTVTASSTHRYSLHRIRLQEPLADAMLFEPIPYRAALAEGTNPNPNPSPNPNSNPNPYANPYSNPDS